MVYLTGISGNTPTVNKAQANASGTMPAFGIVSAGADANNTVDIVTFGSSTGHSVTAFGEAGITFALGDTVYVSATEAGKLTNIAPTGESNLIQNIGKIERSSPPTNMTIKVGGAGRTNATPALDDGNIFIGNAQNQSSTVSLATAITTAGALMDSEVTNLAQVKAFDTSEYATSAQGSLADSAVQLITAPGTSIGQAGDVEGLVAMDSNYIYYCTAAHDSSTNIWKRVAWSGDTW